MAYYTKKKLQELIPWTPDLPMGLVSVSVFDKNNGSPKKGDLIAINPEDATDMWLVAESFARDYYHYVGETLAECAGL